MPELPEVETVCRGLRPVMEGFNFTEVILNRPNLRFPFAPDFIDRIEGQTLIRLTRRAKFLQAELETGHRLYMHLGMSGRFTITQSDLPSEKPELMPGDFAIKVNTNPKHDHVIFKMSSGYTITYNDPRRFGFMELVAKDAPYRLDGLGPEPLGNDFNAPALSTALKGRKSKIKGALLDQKIIAGLGNIYVCEALFRAGISPLREAGALKAGEIETLTACIKDVIRDAIKAGGSSLRDFTHTDGDLGYFQHSFQVYGREGEPCPACKTPIMRITQSGRSSFYCMTCQN